MVNEVIYNTVLYNYKVKRVAGFLLRSRFLTGNPIYRFLYGRATRRKMRAFEKVPFRVMLENTNLCEAYCAFCPHKDMKRQAGVMDFGLTRKIIDECRDLSIDHVTIYGFGEPLLDRDFFRRVEYAKRKGIKRVTTNTNAAFLDEGKNGSLIASGINEVYISFDAFTEGTYKKIRPNLDFDKVKQNILDLIDRRNKNEKNSPLIVLSFVENDINKNEVQSYINYWKGKADYVSVSLAHNWTGDMPGCPVADGSFRDPCRLLWTDMFILYNGDVALCCNDFDGRIIIGNVKERSIRDIWSGERLGGIRREHIRRNFGAVNVCKDCNYNYHYKSNWWVSK
ncbi:MAG: radical SAM protein [Candidatus Omnitrophota bacterium]